MATDQIFPVIIAQHAAGTIELTLDSLREFPEVIVYDYGSFDTMRGICGAYPNTQVVKGEFLGRGRTRNHAANLAEGDWILAIDADEYLSDGLLATLRSLRLDEREKAYSMNRHNLFMGRDMRWAGWGNEWLVRLYNRRNYHFSDAVVDEKVVLKTGTHVVPLKGTLWRQAVTDLDELLPRISRRSTLAQHASHEVHSPPAIVVRALWAFAHCYLLNLGFLEGWRGLVIATAGAVETFFVHTKRYAGAPRMISPGKLTSTPKA